MNLRLCLISDTHTQHKKLDNLSEADVIIHSGDIGDIGTEQEVEDFIKWYSNLDQFKYKVMIAGNHDRLFELAPKYIQSLLKPTNIIYLQNSYEIIMGMKFYGTPVSREHANWSFNYHDLKLQQYWKMIPSDTDVLITHTAPYGILDLIENNHLGSTALYTEIINRIKPNLNIFGHLHESYGQIKIDNTTYINASLANNKNIVTNKPIYFDL